jgi:hypothetical protein
MAKNRQPPALTSEWPILGHLLAILTVCGAFGLLLSWLLTPTVLANPSVAAYTPPPGTLLMPPPRKMDSPELTALEPSPFRTLAREYDATPEIQPRPEAHVTVRKRQRPRDNPEQAYGYARSWDDGNRQQWNDSPRGGDRQWNDYGRERHSNNRQWNDRQRGSWSW